MYTAPSLVWGTFRNRALRCNEQLWRLSFVAFAFLWFFPPLFLRLVFWLMVLSMLLVWTSFWSFPSIFLLFGRAVWFQRIRLLWSMNNSSISKIRAGWPTQIWLVARGKVWTSFIHSWTNCTSATLSPAIKWKNWCQATESLLSNC